MAVHYSTLTGHVINKQSVEYHTVGFNAVNGFLLWPLAFDPVQEQDYLAYPSFAVGTCRWGMEAMAEHMGVSLGNVEAAVACPLTFGASSRHLPDQDERLARYFYRWLCRQDFLLQQCGDSSWLTGTHLQRITL